MALASAAVCSIVQACALFSPFPVYRVDRAFLCCVNAGACGPPLQTRVLQLEEVCHTQMTRIHELENQVRAVPKRRYVMKS